MVAIAIQFWPGDPLPYHAGERAPTDLRSPVTFTITDNAQTALLKQARRETAPAVLVGDAGAFDRIYGQLNDLKYDVDNAHTLRDVPATVKQRFPGLTEESLRLIQMVNANVYETHLRTLVYRVLPYVPFVRSTEYPAVAERRSDRVALTLSPKLSEYMAERPVGDVIALGGTNPVQQKEIRKIVADNLPEGLTETIASYFFGLQEPTYKYDSKLTVQLADETAAAMKPFGRRIQENQIIVSRGEIITAEQIETLQNAQRNLDSMISLSNRFAPVAGGDRAGDDRGHSDGGGRVVRGANEQRGSHGAARVGGLHSSAGGAAHGTGGRRVCPVVGGLPDGDGTDASHGDHSGDCLRPAIRPWYGGASRAAGHDHVASEH